MFGAVVSFILIIPFYFYYISFDNFSKIARFVGLGLAIFSQFLAFSSMLLVIGINLLLLYKFKADERAILLGEIEHNERQANKLKKYGDHALSRVEQGLSLHLARMRCRIKFLAGQCAIVLGVLAIANIFGGGFFSWSLTDRVGVFSIGGLLVFLFFILLISHFFFQWLTERYQYQIETIALARKKIKLASESRFYYSYFRRQRANRRRMKYSREIKYRNIC